MSELEPDRVSHFTERTGRAEVLLDDVVVGIGTYNLVLERLTANGAFGDHLVRARGTIRLQDGHIAHKAMAAPTVRLRLDENVEVTVDVHLYVPGASFIAFTCTEPSVLSQLLRRGDDR